MLVEYLKTDRAELIVFFKKMTIYKQFSAFIIFILIFQELLISLKMDFMKYTDELIAFTPLMFGVGQWIFFKKTPKVVIYVIFGLIYFWGISAILGENRDLFSISMQVLIHFKLFLIYLVFRYGYFFLRKYDMLGILNYCLKISLLMSFLGMIANIVLGDRFFMFFDANIILRDGAYRYEGFQLKPNDAAFVFSFIYFFYSYRFSVDKKWTAYVLISVVCVGMILMNGSRTALIGVMLSWIALASKSAVSKLVGMVMISVVATAFLMTDYANFFINETLKNIGEFSNIDNSNYIRAIMIYYGVKLAGIYFPIGSGAASFGSVMSVGSPVYSQLGIAGLPFFEDFWGVYDSNFATIFGEFGLAGLLYFYLFMPVAIYRDVRAISSVWNYDKSRFLLFLFFFSAFLSVTNPFFMYHFSATIFCLSVFLIALHGDVLKKFN